MATTDPGLCNFLKDQRKEARLDRSSVTEVSINRNNQNMIDIIAIRLHIIFS
jgi:hypothetical protein